MANILSMGPFVVQLNPAQLSLTLSHYRSSWSPGLYPVYGMIVPGAASSKHAWIPGHLKPSWVPHRHRYWGRGIGASVQSSLYCGKRSWWERVKIRQSQVRQGVRGDKTVLEDMNLMFRSDVSGLWKSDDKILSSIESSPSTILDPNPGLKHKKIIWVY